MANSINDWEITGVGNYWTDYKCKKCGHIMTVNPEDEMTMNWSCIKCSEEIMEDTHNRESSFEDEKDMDETFGLDGW